MANWLQHRIRSKWVETALPIIILNVIKSDEPDEWELMSALHHSFGSDWSLKDAKKVLDNLIQQDFVTLDKNSNRLRISGEGLQLFSKLRKEHAEIVASLQL